MTFKVERVLTGLGARCGPETPHEDEWDWRFMWTLIKGKDDPICRSAGVFDSEKAARSDIARARKSMPGVKFAKVEVIDERS